MNSVTMYTTATCPYCVRAKALLQKYDVTPSEVRIDLDDAKRKEMMARTSRRTVPQIYIGGTHVGGYQDLELLHKNGVLQKMLNE